MTGHGPESRVDRTVRLAFGHAQARLALEAAEATILRVRELHATSTADLVLAPCLTIRALNQPATAEGDPA